MWAARFGKIDDIVRVCLAGTLYPQVIHMREQRCDGPHFSAGNILGMGSGRKIRDGMTLPKTVTAP
jgi:hypothetical protein